MTMKLQALLNKCKDAIEQAARDSYNDGNTDCFKGCDCMVDLDNDAQIEISADRHGALEVIIYHDNNTELPNFENYIKSWLDANVNDLQDEWQDEYDHDDWRDVDPGCDPAFPHYGDFERWAYGR